MGLSIKEICSQAPSENLVEAELRRADASLLVDGEDLVYLNTGKRQSIQGGEKKDLSPEAIAGAAAHLLADKPDTALIALFLPSEQFVATSFSLPKIGVDKLRGALRLQLPKLLPGVEQDMDVAARGSGMIGENTNDVALWLPVRVIDSLCLSFEKVGLRLGCLLPRPLAFTENKPTSLRIYDHGAVSQVFVDWQNNSILCWSQVTISDMEVGPFREQWQQLQDSVEAGDSSALMFPEALQKRLPFTPDIGSNSYCFYPTQAVNNYLKRFRSKRKRIVALLVCLGALLISIPLLKVSLQETYAQNRLQQLQKQTNSIRRMKYRANEFDAKWAIFSDFPVQDVDTILQTFEGILPDNTWLTSFEMKSGFVEIEGYTSDPAAIFEIIERNNLFSQVAFSKATSRKGGSLGKEYFAIRCRLAGVDVESYLAKYFSNK